MTSSSARPPAVAGSFYPGSEKALRDTVRAMLDRVKPASIKGRVIGLIAPHAGYMYSGQVAANAFRIVEEQKFDAVVVVAPSHHVYFEGSSIWRQGPYKTPLGEIEIARTIADAIAKADSSIKSRPDAHLGEHSLEVELPFLQVASPNLRIVPIVMGDQSLGNCRRLAEAIASSVKGVNVLLVASSDLSHFHDYDEAVRLDGIVEDHIRNYDVDGLARDLDSRSCEACGGGPIITVMLAARKLGATKAVVLKYANSGDVTGDKSSVVGYVAAALVSDDGGGRAGTDLGLKHDDQAELLKIARQSIEARVLGKAAPAFKVSSAALRETQGAFVTLTEGGDLRGCIGQIVGVEPLYKSVSDMAMCAATEDPRFSPLEAAELDKVAIEISVLTPMRKISDPDEIQVGRDGIYLEKGPYHGLLLPQVATDYGWDRYEFLDQTCHKAGLPAGSWRDGATIRIFSCQVFNEAEVLGSKPSK